MVAAAIAIVSLVIRASLAGSTAWLDANPVTCVGAKVAARTTQPGLSEPTVSLQAGMRCTVRAHVTNNGWFPVSVTSATFPLAGNSALDVRAVDFTGGIRLVIPDDVDAQFSVDGVIIQPGEDTVVESVIEYDGLANMSPCASTSIHMPELTLSSLGLSGSTQPESAIAFLQGDPAVCG